ncbi:MAG: NAD(P)-dependent oxidoreductase [Ectothiorhodospira sp.]
MALKVGCIGLGIMGRPMALNLLKAGVEVHVWARRAEVAADLEAAGAQVARTPAKLARRVDVVFTNVSDSRDVEQVLTGHDGVIEGAYDGLVVVDHSTIAPAVTRRLARTLEARGVRMLDAPVSGGERGAIDGTLALMVGGPAEALERVRPLLEITGGRITHVGGHGAGQVTKACNQLVVAQTLSAVSEALALARAAGVDPEAMREALLGGLAGSRVLERHGRHMIDGDYTPGFKTRLHAKDMGIVLQTAAELGLALPGAALATQWLNAAVGEGHGDEDSAVIAERYRPAGTPGEDHGSNP